MDSETEPPRAVNPFRFQPTCNFLAGGHSRTIIALDHARDRCSSHSAVHRLARDIASNSGPYLIVNIGVSNMDAAACDGFEQWPTEVLRVSWRKLGTPHPASEASIACDPENPADLEFMASKIDASRPVLIILADVIGYLADPRYLLRTIRQILKRNAANRLAISTCEWDRTTSNPSFQTQVRQWSSDEFHCALSAAGFHVVSLEHAESTGSCPRTIVAEVACSEDFYAGFLSSHKLPPSADHVVVTTEDASAGRTGVIGSYLAEAQKTGSRLIVYAGAPGLSKERPQSVGGRGWLDVADLCCLDDETRRASQAIDPDQILQALQQVLFLYDDVRLVEYQDYDGIGVRIAQAKRAALIPPSIGILAYAHGNHLHREAVAGVLDLNCAPAIHVRERLSLELADHVAFPSADIRNLYVEYGGYKLRAEISLPYPFEFKRGGTVRYDKIRTLIFCGEGRSEKPYRDFIDATVKLFNQADYAASIDSIVLIGVKDPDPGLKQLPVKITCGEWDREQAAELLRRHAPEALVALPFRNINSVLLYEIADSGCQFVAYRAEDAPQLQLKLGKNITCSPTPQDLADAFHRLIGLSDSGRARLINRARAFLAAQAARNTEKYREGMEAAKRESLRYPDNEALGALTVVVPNLNGRKEHLADMVSGIRHSSFRPSVVIFVDDGSDSENLAELQGAAFLLGSIPRQIILNRHNVGLPSARNIGLAETKTPYVCMHDNDNIVQNRFFELACRILDQNPEVAAVTGWTRLFDDGEQWQIESHHRSSYRPLGADIGLGLRQNVFGDSLAVYRVQSLRELGGWDASSNAMWGNWQLLARLAARGDDVWIVPAEQFLYRVRADSMQRTYEQFPAWLRLTRILPFLQKAQSVSLARAVWAPVDSPAWRVEFKKIHEAWAAENEQWAANVKKMQDAWSAHRSSLEKEVQQVQTEVDALREIQEASSAQRLSLENEVQRSSALTMELRDQLADARVVAGDAHQAWAAENERWAANVRKMRDAWSAQRSSLEKEVQQVQTELDALGEMQEASSAQRLRLENEVQRSSALAMELRDQLADARVAAGNVHEAWAADNERRAVSVEEMQNAWSAQRSSLEQEIQLAQAEARDLRYQLAKACAVAEDAKIRIQRIESSKTWRLLRRLANLTARYPRLTNRVRAVFSMVWKK